MKARKGNGEPIAKAFVIRRLRNIFTVQNYPATSQLLKFHAEMAAVESVGYRALV